MKINNLHTIIIDFILILELGYGYSCNNHSLESVRQAARLGHSVLTVDVIEPDLPKLHLHVSNKCGLLLLELILINDPNALNWLLEFEVAIVVSTKQ